MAAILKLYLNAWNRGIPRTNDTREWDNIESLRIGSRYYVTFTVATPSMNLTGFQSSFARTHN